VRQANRCLLAALAAVLAVAGLAACGGGDDSTSTTTSASTGAQQAKSGKSSSTGKGGGKESKPAGEPRAKFKPKQHEDSGGGSAQVRAKEGNTSIVEFGKESSQAEFEQAAVTLHNFLDAAAVNDWAAACDYMAKQVVEGLERLAGSAKLKGCAAILEKLSKAPEAGAIGADAKQADILSLRTDGKRAFAIYRGRGGTPLAIGMAKQGGEWKVAGLIGEPLG
jgi:hypothetical protein